MNVFMITSVPMVPPWDQGDKNLAYALTTILQGHRFRILTTRNGQAPVGGNLKPEPIYRSSHPSLFQKAQVFWRLLLGHPDDIDLYHLIYRPYALSSWLCRLLPEFRRRPTLHTVPATADGGPLSSRLFFAHKLVVLSEYGLQALRGLGLTNVVRIPPGVDVSRWAALQAQADQWKARLGLDGHPVLLFPGHYGPGQGADVLLRALPLIRARVPDVRVIFACRLRSAGDRERERKIRETVSRWSPRPMVGFYNTVADMRPFIGTADLTLLPLETMRHKVDIPLILLESLAAGKPIVISNLPPMNEVLREATAGLAVPPGDAEALAEAVVDLLRNPDERARMGREGQKLVEEYFNIHRVAQQYNQLYQEISA